MIYLLSVILSMNFDDLTKLTQIAKTVNSLNQMGATPVMAPPGPACMPCGPPMFTAGGGGFYGGYNGGPSFNSTAGGWQKPRRCFHCQGVRE